MIQTISMSEEQEEFARVASLTNNNVTPIFYVNNEYLIQSRDFYSPQQALNALKYLGDPTFKNPPSEEKIFEYLKTFSSWYKK